MIRTIAAFGLALVLGFATDASAADTRRRQESEKAAEIARLQQELKIAKEDLEKAKVSRWQDKRNAIARKEAFAEAWDDIRREIDALNQRRSQKEGVLLRLDNQVAQQETEVKALEDRMREFGIQAAEKSDELTKAVKSGFPYQNDKVLRASQGIRQDLEARGFRIGADAIEGLFAQQENRWWVGETREITREQFTLKNVSPANPVAGSEKKLPENPGIVAGFFVRLGAAYETFISTEGPDAAILAKSGNLGDQPWIWLENIPPEKKIALQQVKQQIISGDSSQVMYVPLDVLLRKSTGQGFTAEEGTTIWEEIWVEWMGAGFVIYILWTVVGLGLLIIVQKLYVFLLRGAAGARWYRKIQPLVRQGRFDDARKIVAGRRASITKVFHAILGAAHGSRKDAEEASYAAMLKEIPQFERQVNTINVLSSAAPLVGLLGTVSGMVNLFSAITMHGTNDPKIMAAGISEALLATKWGLLVAIPLLVIYNLMANWSSKVVSDMEKYSATLLNEMYAPQEENQGAGDSPAGSNEGKDAS